MNRRRGDGMLLAMGTLTAVPVPAPESVDRRCARNGMLLAPLVAVIPGLAAVVVLTLATAVGLAAPVTGVLAVLALEVATRGLHLDGLADTCDGFAASYHRDRALEVMRRGDSGPAGTAAVVLVLTLQITALAQVVTTHGPRTAGLAMLVAAVTGRATLPVACVRGIPAARPGGLGAAVAGSVPRSLMVAVVLLSAGATTAALARFGGLPWWTGPAALALGLLTTVALLFRAVRRFGGITGDVLGAGVELATAAALVVLAASG